VAVKGLLRRRVREKLDGPAVRALGVRSRKLRNVRKGQSSDGSPKMYFLELLRASEGTLSRWSCLYLQSFVPTPVSGRLTSSRWPVVKTIAESLAQRDENMLNRPHLVGIRVGRKKKFTCIMNRKNDGHVSNQTSFLANR
jgi:hypothetical protein